VRGAKWLFNIGFYREGVVGTPTLARALRAVSGSNHYIRHVPTMADAQIHRDFGGALNDDKVVITCSLGRGEMTSTHIALACR
jgi:hypothetical protein